LPGVLRNDFQIAASAVHLVLQHPFDGSFHIIGAGVFRARKSGGSQFFIQPNVTREVRGKRQQRRGTGSVFKGFVQGEGYEGFGLGFRALYDTPKGPDSGVKG